jgi:hypothetical protein
MKYLRNQSGPKFRVQLTACSAGWWLVLICCEKKILLAGRWLVTGVVCMMTYGSGINTCILILFCDAI